MLLGNRAVREHAFAEFYDAEREFERTSFPPPSRPCNRARPPYCSLHSGIPTELTAKCPATPAYATRSSPVPTHTRLSLRALYHKPPAFPKKKYHVFADTPTPGHNFIAFESTTPVPSLVASAHGVVVDLGPGAGNQLDNFDASRVAHIYGVEPNTAFAPAFTGRLRETPLGQDGKYTLVSCGIEDSETLARFGVVEGSVDCVVSMQVLVSFPFLRPPALETFPPASGVRLNSFW